MKSTRFCVSHFISLRIAFAAILPFLLLIFESRCTQWPFPASNKIFPTAASIFQQGLFPLSSPREIRLTISGYGILQFSWGTQNTASGAEIGLWTCHVNGIPVETCRSAGRTTCAITLWEEGPHEILWRYHPPKQAVSSIPGQSYLGDLRIFTSGFSLLAEPSSRQENLLQETTGTLTLPSQAGTAGFQISLPTEDLEWEATIPGNWITATHPVSKNTRQTPRAFQLAWEANPTEKIRTATLKLQVYLPEWDLLLIKKVQIRQLAGKTTSESRGKPPIP